MVGDPVKMRYGTSSWSEKSWVGPFYPPGTRPADFLRYYATQFDTVEADVTYYRTPGERMVAGWRSKVPEGFALAAKFPRSIVHAGEGARPDPERVLVPEHVGEELETFLGEMRLLGDRCGPLVLQFPFFNREVFAGLDAFLERLDPFLAGLPADFRYAVEVRNKGWLEPELIDCLRRRSVGFVLVDLVYMPHPGRLLDRLDLFPTDFTYVRLIGDRKKVDSLTETFDEVVIDRGKQLAWWADVLAGLGSSVREAYVYANNHYAGHGPATIRQLASLVEERGGEGLGEAPRSAPGELPF